MRSGWARVCLYTYVWVPARALMCSSVALDKCLSPHFITDVLAWLAAPQTWELNKSFHSERTKTWIYAPLHLSLSLSFWACKRVSMRRTVRVNTLYKCVEGEDRCKPHTAVPVSIWGKMAGGWEERKQTGLMIPRVCVCVCVAGRDVWSVVMSDIKHTAAT